MSATAPALAPRCPAHTPMRRKDCHRCRLRVRSIDARRQAAIAAGTWQFMVPAGPVAEHCRSLRAAGLSYRQQAVRSGVSLTFITELAADAVTAMEQDIADALHALTPPPASEATGRVDRVDACGTRRRIIGMGVNGWTYVEQAQRLGTDRMRVAEMTTLRCVSRATADKVKALADELYGLTGPAPQCVRNRLVKRGGVPLEYWGDDIDDPAAVPHIPDLSTYVDEVAVQQAVAGVRAHGDLTEAEKVAAVTELAARGMTDRETAVRLRWMTRNGNPAERAVRHLRTIHGIAPGRDPDGTSRDTPYDEARVCAAVRGEVTAADLQPMEKVEAVRRLVADGLDDLGIAERLVWRDDPNRGAGAVLTYRYKYRISRRKGSANRRNVA